MKAHEFIYLISLFVVILSIAFYLLSTTVFTVNEEEGAENLLGKSTEEDSTLSAEDLVFQFHEMEREKNSLFLWIGVPAGIVLFVVALVWKRIRFGPDQFIDREENDEEVDSFYCF